jgi:dTDP-4-amino-4,6-dideoxygalactose transaminase
VFTDCEARVIELACPTSGAEEAAAVLEVLGSGRFVHGPKVEAFEAAFARRHGAEHGVAVSSGTTALVALLGAHEIGPGDEVVVPAFTFFATVAAVLAVGAVPVLADIDPDTYCLDPEAARAAISPRTRAVMPVHLFGQPADMPRFEALCGERGLALFEDAAQAHGAAVGERPVGSFGGAAFSFYATKNMTTGEGGIVLTNDATIAARLRRWRNHGRGASGLHEIAGTNARMPELAAAVGLVQLERLAAANAARRANARYFDERLRGVSLPRAVPGTTHVYHQYTLRLPPGADREAFVVGLAERGVRARAYYATPCHRQPALRAGSARVEPLPETERASREVLSIPVHPALDQAARDTIVDAVCTLATRGPH